MYVCYIMIVNTALIFFSIVDFVCDSFAYIKKTLQTINNYFKFDFRPQALKLSYRLHIFF